MRSYVRVFSNLSRHSIPVTLNFFEKKFFVLFFPKRLWFLSNPKYLQSISHLQSFHRSRFEIMTVDQTCLQQFVTLNSCYSLIFKFLRHLAPPTFSLKITKKKKNTLTGPANCKKTTRHHAHLSLCAKSRKTNDAKSRKWPKTSIWAIFWRFRGQISPNCKFFWKIGFIQIEGHI